MQKKPQNPLGRASMTPAPKDVAVRLRSLQQLFDCRDPAPFRERGLDEGAVDYITTAAEDIPKQDGLRIVLWFEEEPELPDALIAEAVRAHFDWMRDRTTRRLYRHLRQGRSFLGGGLLVLSVFLTAVALLTTHWRSPVTDVFREGLVIIAWVAMWRPIESLLYDWWPLFEQRRLLRRLALADVRVIRP